jgi:hypothetical protein
MDGRVLIITLALGAFLPAQTPPWKGTVSVENGVTVVKNPKKPAYGDGAITLEEELSIGKPGGEPNYQFSRLWYLAVDDEENIFAMDQADSQVKVFDKKGAFLRAIGKKGEGPGEFLHPNNIFLTPQRELVVEDYIRNLTYFSIEGKYLRTVSTVRIFPIGMELDASGRMIALRNIPDPEKPGKELDLYDPSLDFRKTLATFPQPKPDPSLIRLFLPDVRWALLANGNLVVASREEYEIEIFDLEGKLIRKIIRDCDFVKITDEDVRQKVPKMPEGRKLVVPKYFPAVRSLMADDEGRVYVGTYEKSSGGAFLHDIFDPEGRYIAAVAIKGNPQVWKKQKLYVVDEDKDGFQFIKIYRVVRRFS